MTYLPAEIEDKRSQAAELFKKGSYKESLALSKELLKSTKDQNSGKDLNNAISCLNYINQKNSVDLLVEEMLVFQEGNFYIYGAAASYFQKVSKHGSIIDSEFIRNNYSGRRVSSVERDRIRVLQLYQKGLELLKSPDIPKSIASLYCQKFSQALIGQGAFRLQTLTDLSTLPDYEDYNYYYNRVKGAPTTPEGAPVFYSMPASYTEAKSDGERYRAILAQIESYGHETQAKRLYADFLASQFGVQTLRFFSWVHHYNFSSKNDNKKAILSLHTLEDSETSANLAGGVKRFTLPDEHNHLKIYKELFDAEKDDGLVLANYYLDRMQFTKAAKVLQTSLRRQQNNDLQGQLERIVGDRIEFQGVSGVFPVGLEPSLGIKYRNAEKATLKVQEVDLDKLYADTKKWLDSNPEELDWHRLRFLRFDYHQDNHRNYLGQVISDTELDLSPREGHWDTVEDIQIPIKNAGFYRVTLELENGTVVHSYIRLDDLTVVKEYTEKGGLYSVVHAITGEPVANAQLEFSGYKQERLGRDIGNRRYHVTTHNFSVKTDEKGQYLVKTKSKFKERFQYALQVKAGEKRAYLDFQGHYHSHRNYGKHNKVHSFGITDRPVYRPEQTVYGKLWLRDAKYDKPDSSTYADKNVSIQIYNPKGEKFGEPINVKADAYGGVEYSVDLPEDATLGIYNVSV